MQNIHFLLEGWISFTIWKRAANLVFQVEDRYNSIKQITDDEGLLVCWLKRRGWSSIFRDWGCVWQHLLSPTKFCLTARRNLSARGLVQQPGVWDIACARSLLLGVNTSSSPGSPMESVECWAAEMYWSSRTGGCLVVKPRLHHVWAHWSHKVGSNHNRPWACVEWLLGKVVGDGSWQRSEDKNIYLCMGASGLSYPLGAGAFFCGGGEERQWYFFSLCRKTWADKNKVSPGWRNQCRRKSHRKALKAVPYVFCGLEPVAWSLWALVIHHVSLQGFSWDSFSLTRKQGVAHELRYFKHGPDAYNGITSIIDSSSQISHQIWNSDGIQQCDTWEVFGSACQSALVLWERQMSPGKSGGGREG